MAFLVAWTKNGKTGSEWFPDHVLQSVMDRVWRSFGTPGLIAGGPCIGPPSKDTSTNTPTRAQRKSGRRLGRLQGL